MWGQMACVRNSARYQPVILDKLLNFFFLHFPYLQNGYYNNSTYLIEYVPSILQN